MKKGNHSGIALFEKKQVRRVWYKNQWWFVIIDVIAVLTDSADPSGYLKDIRRRDPEIEKGWGQIATPLLVETAGRTRKDIESQTKKKVITSNNYLSQKALKH